MRLIHLLEDLPKTPSKWAMTNVESISIEGDDVIFNFDQTDLKMARDDLKNAERMLKKIEKEEADLKSKLSDVEAELKTARNTLLSYEISPTDTIGDLIERNEDLSDQLFIYKTTCANYLSKFREMEKEITELRARKNKATLKRCLTTGKLLAEYQGKTYFLTEKTE
jgi:multidrug resistance efflux pump